MSRTHAPMWTGVRMRVTVTVLAVSSVLFSLLATLAFVQIANSGRDAIRERINVVLDDLEAAVRGGTGTVDIATPDGVSAQVSAGDAAPGPDGGSALVVRREIEVAGTPLVLVGVSSQARLSDSLHSLYRGLWIGIPLASLLSALMAGLATSRALRPVADIIDRVEQIGARPAGARVPVPPTADEVEHLARTVNEMLDRIDAGRVAQGRFTSDAAHELRTPLMALQGELELAAGGVDAVDGAAIERMQTLAARLGARIDDLVLLSTLDEDRPLGQTPVIVLDVVREEAEAISPSIVVTGLAVVVEADRALLARAVRNLLANAQRHAASSVSATVVVDAATDAAADRIWVHVDDDGPGVDPEVREQVFERFSRLDESRATDRGGSGLGLAIVASVAGAHDGGVSVTDSPLGGARVSMWLPLSPAVGSAER